MNDLDLLRRVRADVPTDPDLAAARQRLVAHATGTTRRSRSRRAPVLLAAAAVLVVLVAGVVVASPFSTEPATASALLHRAADRVEEAPTTGPGQYLAVETRADSLGYVEGANGIAGAYRSRTRSTTYVPHDADGVWVRRYWSEQPEQFYGGAVVRAGALRDFATEAHADDPGVERGRGGQFGNGELGGGSVGIGTSEIPTLPRDPRRLLDRLRGSGGAGDSPSQAAVGSASGLLQSGLVPTDLRRALYDALALLPDARVVDDTVTMSGRSGTAIGVQDGHYVWSVVIDPESGDYLGDLQTQRDRVGAVPAGTVAHRTSVTLTVVDEVPTR